MDKPRNKKTLILILIIEKSFVESIFTKKRNKKIKTSNIQLLVIPILTTGNDENTNTFNNIIDKIIFSENENSIFFIISKINYIPLSQFLFNARFKYFESFINYKISC